MHVPERGDRDPVGEVEVRLAVRVEEPVPLAVAPACARSSDRGPGSGSGLESAVMVGSGSWSVGRPSISSAKAPARPSREPGRVAGLGRVRCGHGRLHADRREQARPRGRPGLRRGRDPAVHPRVGREGRGPSRGLRADGRARVPGCADPGGVRRRRDGLPQLRDPVRGAGTCRHLVPCRPERPRRAQLAGPPPVGDRGAAPALAGPAGAWREARDLRADRARRRDRRRQPGRRRPAATATPTGSTARRSGSRWPTSPTISWSSRRSTARRSTRA